MKELCDSLLSQQIPSPHLLAMMVDMYEEEAAEGDKESLAKAKEVGGAPGGVDYEGNALRVVKI